MVLNNFRKQIIETINKSGLSVDCVYFVLKDIMNDVVTQYNQLIEIEEQKKMNDNDTKEDCEEKEEN